MATVSNIVEMVLKLKGGPAFQAEATKATKSVLGMGKATEESGKKAKMGWKRIAGAATAGAAIYKATNYVHGAVEATDQLARSTIALQRSTNMDAKTASSWAEILKVRGINVKQFQQSMTKMSRTMESARQGNKKSIEVFRMLGVSQDAINSGDVSATLMQTADAMQRIKSPAQRASLAQQVLGRSANQLMPLLMGGSEAIQEQIDMVQKYGASLSSTEGAKEMIANQREMRFAMDGLKITLGKALLPLIEAFTKNLLTVVQTIQPVLKNTTMLQLVLGALAIAFLALKVAMFVTQVQALGLTASMLLIPAAILAVAAGLVYLYTKWGWFHRAVDNTWNFIKSHWLLLLEILVGPFGAATIEIIKNFDAIKAAFGSVVHWIAQRWRDLIGLVKRAVGVITGAVHSVTGMPGRIAGKVAHGLMPHFAEGGTMGRSGMALVGEAGPEVVALPRAAQVTPIDRSTLGAAGGTVITKVFLDKRQIAEAVGGYTADRKARR